MFCAGTITERVRLIGGTSATAGRLEVYHDGTWGSVCGVGWGQNDANVVCKQLGYARALSNSGNVGQYGYGTGQVSYSSMGQVSYSSMGQVSYSSMGQVSYSSMGQVSYSTGQVSYGTGHVPPAPIVPHQCYMQKIDLHDKKEREKTFLI